MPWWCLMWVDLLKLLSLKQTTETTHREQGTTGSTLQTAHAQVVDRVKAPVEKMLRGLVFLFLFVSPVLSLECYVCSSTSTNEECNMGTQECQVPLDTCMTIVDTFGSSKAIVKQCASRATCSGAASTASVDSSGNGNAVTCCSSSNYCNYNGADAVRVHSTLLLLTAAVSLLLSR